MDSCGVLESVREEGCSELRYRARGVLKATASELAVKTLFVWSYLGMA